MPKAHRLAPSVLLPTLLLPLLLWVGAPQTSAEDDGWKAAKKAFKAAQKADEWKTRRDGYLELAYQDSAEAVNAILSAIATESNPAVVFTAIDTLAAFQSTEARGAIESGIRKGRGAKKLYLLMALEKQKGEAGKALLLEVLDGKDSMARAQAAIALGNKKIVEAIPSLEILALDKEWQLRAAAARALEALSSQASIKALAASLAMSKGSERRQIIHALEELTGEKFGLDAKAWAKLADGTDGSEIQATPVKLPYVFGIPIYGKRVVLIMTNSQRNENPHRFGAGDRLEALCAVPGSRPILHTRLVTVGTFIRAHLKRVVNDLPSGTKFELLVFSTAVNGLFSKFMPATGGNKKVAVAAIDGAVPSAGMNHYDALIGALNLSGSKDKAAWKKGPDEIVFTACNAPDKGEIKEPEVVGAAIALKARLRMVPVHTIGVETHAYEMMKTIAGATGGVYLNLYE